MLVMRFRLEHRIGVTPEACARAFADPGLYPELTDLPKLGGAEVVDHREDGDRVELRVRYRFTGELSSAAKAVIDPARLTWVDESVHDLAKRAVTYRMVADHYADRFSCSGAYRFEPDGDGTVRITEGELKVRALLVGGAVEKAIVSGLDEHLTAEGPIVEQYVARKGWTRA